MNVRQVLCIGLSLTVPFASAQGPALDIEPLIGAPLGAFDALLGKPAKVVRKSGGGALGEERVYDVGRNGIRSVSAQCNREDLVPAYVGITFAANITSWKNALALVGIAVPKSAHLSKYGREAFTGDNILGLSLSGVTVFWAPVDNRGKSAPRLTFTLARSALDKGNRLAIAQGVRATSAPLPTKGVPVQNKQDTIPPTPFELDARSASRSITVSRPHLIIGNGYGIESGGWVLKSPGSYVECHPWPYAIGGSQDYDVWVQVKTSGNLSMSATDFQLQVDDRGVVSTTSPIVGEEGTSTVPMNRLTSIQISRRGRVILVLLEGRLVFRSRVPGPMYRPSSYRVTQIGSGTSNVSEVRWRTPGFKESSSRAPSVAPAVGRLRFNMTDAAVGRLLGGAGSFVEAGSFPNGRWTKRSWKLGNLGSLNAGFLNGRIYVAEIVLKKALPRDEFVRCLGLGVAEWARPPLDPNRGWEASFIDRGKTKDGAKISTTGDGLGLWIEWRDESSHLGRR